MVSWEFVSLLITAVAAVLVVGQVASAPEAHADHRTVNCVEAYTSAMQSGQTVDEANNCPIELVNADPARFTQADTAAGHHPSMCNPDPSLCIAAGIVGAVVVIGGAVLIGAILLGMLDDGPSLGGGGTVVAPPPLQFSPGYDFPAETTFGAPVLVNFTTVHIATNATSPPGTFPVSVANFPTNDLYFGSNCTLTSVQGSLFTVTCA